MDILTSWGVDRGGRSRWGLSRSAVSASLASIACYRRRDVGAARQDSGWVNALPVGAQWYLRPAGDLTNFTLFPWAGFVFAGGAVGVLIAAVRDQRTEMRVHLSLAAAGAALIALGFYGASLPTIYRQSSFWTSSPTYFAIRTGVMMLALAATMGGASSGRSRQNPDTTGTPGSSLCYCLLDPRRARIRVRHVANPAQAGYLGDRHRVVGILRDDLRVCYPAGPPGRSVAHQGVGALPFVQQFLRPRSIDRSRVFIDT